MPDQERQGSARSIHRSLLKLFLIFWLCVVLHLHGVMHHEVWPHGPVPRLMAAVPPIVPFVFIAWGKVGPAVFTLVAMLAAAACWLVAVRNPQEPLHRILARIAIVFYWLALWFPMALSA